MIAAQLLIFLPCALNQVASKGHLSEAVNKLTKIIYAEQVKNMVNLF
jgi:hypothetical protein